MYSVQKIEYIVIPKNRTTYQSWWSKIQKACETECDQATWAEIRKKIQSTYKTTMTYLFDDPIPAIMYYY